MESFPHVAFDSDFIGYYVNFDVVALFSFLNCILLFIYLALCGIFQSIVCIANFLFLFKLSKRYHNIIHCIGGV